MKHFYSFFFFFFVNPPLVHSSSTHGGFSNENMKREELLKLMEILKRDGVQYIEKPYYVAGYDSPFKLTNRRNEVWVLRKEPEQ